MVDILICLQEKQVLCNSTNDGSVPFKCPSKLGHCVQKKKQGSGAAWDGAIADDISSTCFNQRSTRVILLQKVCVASSANFVVLHVIDLCSHSTF